MKNTSRKLFISVFALLFAVVAVATTSFAWFTISGKARVDQFELNISTGEGIQVQLTLVNGTPTIGATATTTGWVNVITSADLQKLLAYQSIKLEHLTSADAVNFYQIKEDPLQAGHYIDTQAYDITTANTSAAVELLQFDLHFRANTEYTIRLTEESKVASSGKMNLAPLWARTYDPQGDDANPADDVKQSYDVYPADAMNIGFVFSGTAAIWTPTDEWTPTGEETPRDLDLNPNRAYGYVNTATVGTGDPAQRDYAKDGAYEFFNDYMHTVNVNDPVGTDYLQAGDPTNDRAAGLEFGAIKDEEALKDLVVLGSSEAAYVDPFSQYGKMTVRIWLEGWDGDCFNAIYNGKFNVTMAFEGIAPQA